MKRSTAVLLLFLLVLGLTILITAASCSSSSDLRPQTAITSSSITSVDTIEYPYEKWDTMYYSRMISYINGEASSIDYDKLTVVFNEEFIEITDHQLGEQPTLIYVGHWTNKFTFIIDNNYGVVTVNLKTGYMTIRYGSYSKEIYTH